jgi:uncharacterized repeat protein (TIGR01451 family)
MSIAVVTLVLIVAPIASAHHPIITVTMDCNGKVSYTVTAWQDSNPLARTFTGVKVYWGSTVVGTGNLNGADNFTFTGSFSVDSSVNSVTLTAITDGTWGDNYSGVDQWSDTAERPTDCLSGPTISTILASTSTTGGGTVHDTSALSGASSHPTGTVTYTVYSDSTCTSKYADAGIKTLNSDGTVPNSNDVTFNTPGDYYWQAVYSGDSNNAGATSPCTSEHLVVTRAGPAVSTQASGPVTLGGKIHDVATLSGAAGATGAVTFQVFAPGDTSCSTALATLSTSSTNIDADGNGTYTSGDFTTTTAGTYRWRAFFAGDTNNAAVSGACNAANESSTANQSGPAVSTQASTSATVGDKIHDVATLSGAAGATGAVTFQVFAPGDTNCSAAVATLTTASKNVNADGNGTYTSGDFTTTTAGTYRWRAFFAGDTNNSAVSAACNAASESTTVSSPPPATPNSPATPNTPAISITKNPKSQTIQSGGAASFSITVTNTGNVTLTNVTVTDSLAPACNASSSTIPALASMAPGVSVSYNCALTNVTASFTNSATVTGTPPSGPNVTATDTAPVTVTTPPPPAVTHPKIAITKDPASQTIGQGGKATFTITVTNTGDVTLTDVTVTDPKSTNCSRDLGTLDAGKSKSYTCTKPDVAADFLNVATVTGKPPTGPNVQASDSANVNVKAFVPPQSPKIAIVKSPKLQALTTKLTATRGTNGAKVTTVHFATATFEIKVTNTGNVALHGVRVTDPKSPNCDRTIGSLAAGASTSYACTRPAVSSNFTNVASVIGVSPQGKRVTAADHAMVAVKVKTTHVGGTKPSNGGKSSNGNNGPTTTGNGSPQFTG